MKEEVIDRVDTRAEDQAAKWRSEADADHPAGPLYSSGVHAEADIAGETARVTALCGSGMCGTGCTYSRNRLCC